MISQDNLLCLVSYQDRGLVNFVSCINVNLKVKMSYIDLSLSDNEKILQKACLHLCLISLTDRDENSQ